MAVRLIGSEIQSGIRPLNPARDLGQLADLIENAFGAELTEGGQRILREIRILSWLGPLNYVLAASEPETDSMFTGYVWVADGQVVGNVTVNRPTGHKYRWQISNVAVMDRCQRQGIGRQLVETAVEYAKSHNGQTAYLFVRDDNPHAIQLYHSLGFTEVDSTTELKRRPPPQPRVGSLPDPNPLPVAQGEALYRLVRAAEGAGRRWLYGIRRSQYVTSAEQQFGRSLESLFTGEAEYRWGYPWEGDSRELQAAAILKHTRLWNRGPHRLQLWVHPNARGQVEPALAQDVVRILSGKASRPTYVALPDCEQAAIDALMDVGFAKVRTLKLMRRDL